MPATAMKRHFENGIYAYTAHMLANRPRKLLDSCDQWRECGAGIPLSIDKGEGALQQQTAVQKHNTERRRLILAVMEFLGYLYFIELLPLLALMIYEAILLWIVAKVI